MKQAEEKKEQPWTLSFRARAKRFDFKFKCSKTFLISKFFRLSIRFKLRPFTAAFESKPDSAFSLRRKFKKFLPKFKCFFRRRSGNKRIVKNFLASENYLCGRRGYCGWLWVMLIAAASFFVILQLRFYFTRFFWNFSWMVWNYSPLSEILHQYFKVIFDGIFQSLGF